METQTNQTETNMFTAILASVSGIFGAVGNIWTSSNTLKQEKLEIQKLEEEAKVTADLLKQQQYLALIETKKAAYASAEAKANSSATLRGILIVIGGALAGLVAWLFFKRNPKALVLKK